MTESRTEPPSAWAVHVAPCTRGRARTLSKVRRCMQSVRKSAAHRLVALASLVTLPAALVVFAAGATAAPVAPATGAHALSGTVTSTSLGQSAPTFTGPAATGCSAPGCSLLTGPFRTPSTASASAQSTAKATAAARRLAASANPADGHHLLPSPTLT